MNKLHADNQNKANLLLEVYEEWDFRSNPLAYEMDVIKMDTTGKQIWKCRPDHNDSNNTTNFQMVQKPNGNILCTWSDAWFRPYKGYEKRYQGETTNDSNATIWFAEIDYKTGKVLWKKHIEQYLNWKMAPPIKEYPNFSMLTDFGFTDALLVNANSAVWVGYRENIYHFTKTKTSWKRLPVLLKTDLNGKPIWYREYNFYPKDTGDKGFKIFSFIQTPDKGFILSGEYQNRHGQLSKGEFWQRAVIIKLDSNGCFSKGCDAKDGIVAINFVKEMSKVFPNPASDILNIEYATMGKGSIKLIDIQGKTVYKSNKKETQIHTQHLKRGMYILQIHHTKNNEFESHKIRIE